jgi:hypothetical protein
MSSTSTAAGPTRSSLREAATASKPSHTCIVPGCRREGQDKLGVRCRVWHDGPYRHGKGKTAALWAPDADALLCDEHALGGASITLLYEPDGSKRTTVRVIGAKHVEGRVRPIKDTRP